MKTALVIILGLIAAGFFAAALWLHESEKEDRRREWEDRKSRLRGNKRGNTDLRR